MLRSNVGIDLAGFISVKLMIYLYFTIFKPSHAFKSIRIPHLKYDNALIIYHMLFHKVRRCEVLPPSSNAVIVGQCLTIYLSVCRMQCNEGYEAVGSVERRCGLSANGVMAWSGTPLQCIGE